VRGRGTELPVRSRRNWKKEDDKPTDRGRKNNYLKSLCKKFNKQERKRSKDEILPQEE
jgi:hypothetical protein